MECGALVTSPEDPEGAAPPMRHHETDGTRKGGQSTIARWYYDLEEHDLAT